MRTSTPSRLRWCIAGAVAALLALVVASPAVADPPVHSTDPFSFVVEDAGVECGFPIRWEISGEGRETFFFDDEGRLARIISHTRETNTLTNLATGKTVTDTPRFTQIVHFNEDGTIDNVETMGLYAHARDGAAAKVMDVGKVIIAYGPGSDRALLFEAGPHPLRAESLVTASPAWLGAFCELLA